MPLFYDSDSPKIPEGYQPEDFELFEITLITKKVIAAGRRNMASYIASFSMSWWPSYFVEVDPTNKWTDYALAPELLDWLTMNATDYFGHDEMDRGDWGEGTPICDINFGREDECDAFIAEFQHAIHALSYTDSGINRRKIRERDGLE